MTVPHNIQDVFEKSTCLYTRAEVEKALDAMAADIADQLGDENPLLLCVMIGGLIPMGHLLTRLDFPLEVGYVHATRYNSETRGGELSWKVKPTLSHVAGRTILVLDDILDGGITLQAIITELREMGAKVVYTAVLVDKHQKRLPEGLPNADFVGLKVEDHYVFGYGMDYHEYLRNAPGIYMVAPEHE